MDKPRELPKVLKISHTGITPLIKTRALVASNDPILREKMPDFDFTTRRDAVQVANQLIEVLQLHNALGLAAPQIGLRENVFVMGYGNDIVAFFNPKIHHRSLEMIKLPEGCLSFPNLELNITRAKWIEVEYQDYTGKIHNERFDGLTCQIFQHEYSHLMGETFLKKVGETSLMMAKKKQKKLQRNKK